MATSCAAATDALCSAVNGLLSGMDLPVPLLAEARQLSVCIGTKDGLVIKVVEGQLRVESWHGANSRPEADTTVHIDGVDTLLSLLSEGETAGPRLLLRRKIRLEGSLSWLEQLHSTAPPDAMTPQAWKSVAAEIASQVSTAASTASLSNSFATSSFGSGLWVPDEAASKCMRCEARFTTMRRRHHCRTCGRVLCAACAPRCSSRSRRTCRDCLHTGCSPTSFQSASGAQPDTGSFGFLPACDKSFVVPKNKSVSFQGSEVQEKMQEELAGLLEERRESHELHTQVALANVWFVTQLVIAAVTIVLFRWRLTAVMAWVALLFVLHYFPKCALRRIVQIFWASSVIAAKLWLTRRHVRSACLQGKLKEAEWLVCHRAVARFTFQQICLLGGFWTKLGQQMSVNVALPAPYCEELSKLQDQVSPSPFKDIAQTVQEEFGSALVGLTIDPEAKPLGTASIAQVHKATWKRPGSSESQVVVVKVQHRGVDVMMKRDLSAARLLCIIIALVDPEGVPDMRPIIRKLREVTLNELDFRLEAANQTRGAKAVLDFGVNVVIPEVVPELVARRAMVMSFIDGVSLKEFEKLPEAKPELIVAALVDHYAVQFANDGHFNADPHPGNLMIERGTGKLVVLDWGMSITLSPQVSEAYAKIFCAVATSDIWGMMEALEHIGIHFKDGDVFEPHMFLTIFRFVLKDSKPVAMASQEIEAAMKTGDKMYYEGPKRYQKSPVDVFSGDLIFFGKAVELLYMVSCRLGVSHPILLTFFRRSYARLLGRQGEPSLPQNPHQFLPAFQDVSSIAHNKLEHDLLALLSEFYRNGHLLGVQLCITDAARDGNGGSTSPQVLVDIAVGVQGWASTEPVKPTTLFNLLDISKIIVTLVVLQLVDSGKVKLGETLAACWDSFGKDATSPEKQRITVEHVLGHMAGCWQPVPPSVKTLEELLDFETMLAATGDSPCIEAPGQVQRYHHASFGYLCAGICRHFAKRELADLWINLVASIAAQSKGSMDTQDLLLHVPSDMTPARTLSLIHKTVSSANLDEISAMIGRVGGLMEPHNPSAPIEKVAAELFGREHLVDLALFAKTQGVPSALLPGLQSFGTARAVATVLHSVTAGHVLSRSMVEQMVKSRRTTTDDSTGGGRGGLPEELCGLLQLDGFDDWGLGMQIISPETWSDQSASSPSYKAAWGHLSQSGSVALVLPGEHPRVLAFLVNMIDGAKTHRISRAVLRLLETHATDLTGARSPGAP